MNNQPKTLKSDPSLWKCYVTEQGRKSGLPNVNSKDDLDPASCYYFSYTSTSSGVLKAYPFIDGLI